MNILRKSSNATFDDGIFAEKISYNGMEISAIVEVGENELQKSRGGFNRLSNTVVVSGSGCFTVKTDDIPTPNVATSSYMTTKNITWQALSLSTLSEAALPLR